MWGLDTSHAPHFTRLCNDASQEHAVNGLQVVAAYPGGSPDFQASISRLEKFTSEMRDDLGVSIVERGEDLLDQCDAFMLESVDGRQHREIFEILAAAGKPVFVDKPFAVSINDARAMLELAKEKGVRLFSSSALRYAESVVKAKNKGEVLGADLHGPLQIIPEMPGYFWYGIHQVEMLQSLMGTGCKRVRAVVAEDQELLQLEWQDGRLASLRGKRGRDNRFGGTVFHPDSISLVDSSQETVPFYVFLMQRVARFLCDGEDLLAPEAIFEVVALMEAANISRESGEWQEVESL